MHCYVMFWYGLLSRKLSVSTIDNWDRKQDTPKDDWERNFRTPLPLYTRTRREVSSETPNKYMDVGLIYTSGDI